MPVARPWSTGSPRSTNGEAFLHGVHIPEYTQGTWTNHEPRRVRKLLLNRHEIDKLESQVNERGYTLIPLSLYFKDGRAKVEIALARGKKTYDKRHALAEQAGQPREAAGARSPAQGHGLSLTTVQSPPGSERRAAPERVSRGVRLDIEGLRAIAVTMVLVYHTGAGVLSGGFAGVDVFFVISGFLITSLLLRELTRSGTVSISAFYARRARRLLPAASLVILVTLALGWWVMPSSARSDLGADGIAAALYVLNWTLAARSVDYLAEGAAVSPLQHYWSLCVEEQYYVVWPLAILLAVAVARRLGWRPRQVLLVLVAVGGVASLAYSVWATGTSPATAYFVSTTRVWELAIGSLLAFAAGSLGGLSARASFLLAWSGLAAIACTALLFSRSTPWPGAAALVPTLGTAAVIAAGCSKAGWRGGQRPGAASDDLDRWTFLRGSTCGTGR